MLKRLGIYTILTLLLLSSADAQDNYARFKRLTINDGLSLSSVYCIYQDSKGFMWFGTEDGLNRYDGKNITVYGATTDQHYILANKWIEIIFEDKAGILWLGSRGGLTKYDPRIGTFAPIKYEQDDPLSLSNDTITTIASDLLNNVWVGTRQGLNLVHRNTNEVTRINPVDPELSGLKSGILSLINDKSGTLWISTEKGLYSYEPMSNLFFNETLNGLISEEAPIHCMEHGLEELWVATMSDLIRIPDSGEDPTSYSITFKEENTYIHCLYIGQNNKIWLKTNHGLYTYDTGSKSADLIIGTTHTTRSLMLNPVEPLTEDKDGNIWYGTFGDGLFKINPETNDYLLYTNNPADPLSLSENAINCIYEDRSGVIWCGTFGAGISILDPQANKFNLFKHDPFNRNSLASSFIWTIHQTEDSCVWFGSNEQGISRFDPGTGTFSHFNHDPNDPFSLPSPSVRNIFQDSKGQIWIGTDGGGLVRFEPDTEHFIQYTYDPNDPNSISNNSVRAFFEDSRGYLWVGTRGGLNRFDPEKRSFRRYLHDPENPNSISHNFIYNAILEDAEGHLWIGTYGGGLNMLDPTTDMFTRFMNDPEDPTTISDNIVFSIYEDEVGRFWIGTNSGLNMFYPATGSFRRFGIEEGLANEVIYGVLPDNSGHIWLSTNRGIICFNLDDFTAKNYDISDGLQSNEFNGGAFHKGIDGMLYFGGVYGVTRIDPDKVIPDPNLTEVCITKLEVMGKDVMIAPAELEEMFEEEPHAIIEIEKEYYLKENPAYIEKFILDYRERFFSIEFSALNNLNPENLRYAYKMDNLDEDWNYAGFRNYVSYANMKAGDYTLKIMAQNADGFWSDPPVELNITITPPFWNLWWFIALEVIVGLLIATFIYTYLLRARTNRLLRSQNEQITISNRKLQESERNLKELNATKDKFFSIISHDLRNPFSSLLSISELMVESFDDSDKEDHRAGFKKLNESLKHLYTLLENLLTWSRSQRGRIKYDPVKFNLTNLINENINLHKMAAEKKGLMLCTTLDKEVFAYGDRDMINSVVRNLMTNAVKFTGTSGKIEVDVHTNDKKLSVSIKDDGIGISDENIKRLFRIDEKFKTQGTHGEKGTGLGLIICREFVEKNGGHITVESEPDKGSIFTFTIPKADNPD